jgi:hypothetical protein
MAIAVTAACTSYESAYEAGVADYEPIYCYQSLADAACYRAPFFRDERRLSNYYGPSPRRYDRPAPPPPLTLEPPPPLPQPPVEARDLGGEDPPAPPAEEGIAI